ncbi:MAG: hypothetical protein ABIR48_08260 [Gammaproteobacteria bacterium]
MRSSEDKPAINQVTNEAAPPEWVTQGSLALKMLCRNLRDDKKYAILDLGPAVRENVDFYSHYASKIRIEDLYDSLKQADALALSEGVPDADTNSKEKSFKHILSYSKDTRFDLIFTWDLFNYLTREQLQALVAHLSQFCNRRAVLFSLTTNNQYVSDQPIGFKILDQENLISPPIVTGRRINMRYREPNLARLMPSFKVDKTFLLRNGMHEHLFILDD